MTETKERRNVSVGELFTEEELRRAVRLYNRSAVGHFNKDCVREIVTPEVVARINKLLGQENDAGYLAYVIEYAILASPRMRA
jgi:hypothetical protein